MIRLAGCVMLIVLGACTQFPALEGVESAAAQRADYPELVPISGLLDRAAAGQLRGRGPGRELEARAAELRARAAALRAPVIAPETRARMESALARQR